MASSKYPTNIPDLTIREAVTDTIHRAILAIDTSNESLFRSSLLDSSESYFSVTGGATIQSSSAIHDYMRAKIYPLTTLHQITNIRVYDINEQQGTAKVSASAVAHHYRPEDAFKPQRLGFVIAGIYDVEAVRDEKGGFVENQGMDFAFALDGG
jgi:hypothetical protein